MGWMQIMGRISSLIALIVILYCSPSYAKEGVASWYGGGERLNVHTASGEVFDPSALTCASWHYSFGTRLEVTNVSTGNSVIVRVNDRGPAKRLHRLIDLSRAAFERIASLDRGLVTVYIKEVPQ
jgi:rare lipoprotein A